MKHDVNIHSIPQPSAVPYWNMIKDSSREVKETLLNMLYVSLEEETITAKDDAVTFLSGTWKDNRSSEEIIADIRHARTSVACEMIMVTDNVRHFKNINGIRLENWIDRN